MTITVSVPEALARQAEAQGLSVEAYVERWAQQTAQPEALSNTGQDGRCRAVDNLLAFGEKHRLTLGEGIRIKDLLRESRKY